MHIYNKIIIIKIKNTYTCNKISEKMHIYNKKKRIVKHIYIYSKVCMHDKRKI